MYQAIYATSVIENYLYTTTTKENSKFHKNTLPHDIIFTKEDASNSYEKMGVFSREYNIHYRVCVVDGILLRERKWGESVTEGCYEDDRY